MNKRLIQAARDRVESGAFEDVLQAGREIVARLRIPHTKTLKQSGGLQFTWNWLQTRMNAKYVAFILKKLGYEPSNVSEPSSVRDEFTNGTYNVLVAPQYGVIVVRPVGKEPLRASSETGEPPEDQEFDEYDDYEQWIADAKKHWPKARHNKKGTSGWVQGYGEENDEEFLVGPDLQSDVVGVWNTNDGFGWILRSGTAVTSGSSSFSPAFLSAMLKELRSNMRRTLSYSQQESLDEEDAHTQVEAMLDLFDVDQASDSLNSAHAAEFKAFFALKGNKQIEALKPLLD